MKLLEMTSVKKLAEKPSYEPHCPYCISSDLLERDQITTLIGGGDGSVDRDPNHVWTTFTCNNCEKDFTRETKSGNVWYTEGHRDRHLIAGIATCFETYIWPCKCGGKIYRDYRDLKDEHGVQMLHYKGSEKQFRIFYSCDQCKERWEEEEEYPR